LTFFKAHFKSLTLVFSPWLAAVILANYFAHADLPQYSMPFKSLFFLFSFTLFLFTLPVYQRLINALQAVHSLFGATFLTVLMVHCLVNQAEIKTFSFLSQDMGSGSQKELTPADENLSIDEKGSLFRVVIENEAPPAGVIKKEKPPEITNEAGAADSAPALSRQEPAAGDPAVEQIRQWVNEGCTWGEIIDNLKTLVKENNLDVEAMLAEYKNQSEYREIPDDLAFNATPQKIADYIFKNLKYEKDMVQFQKIDYWQTTGELLENKRGDCEDFAFFAYNLLNLNGMKPLMVNIYDVKQQGHTITIQRHKTRKDAFVVVDGARSQTFQASSIQKLLEKVNPSWNKALIVSFSPETRHVRILKKIVKT